MTQIELTDAEIRALYVFLGDGQSDLISADEEALLATIRRKVFAVRAGLEAGRADGNP